MKQTLFLLAFILSSVALAQTTNAPGIPSSWVAIALWGIGAGVAFLLVRADTLITAKISTVWNGSE